MSEVPALRAALRATAERRHRRRRRVQKTAALTPALAAAAVFVLANRDAPPLEAAATPTPTVSPAPTATPAPAATMDDLMRELEGLYAVFRRPARASDKPPDRLDSGSGIEHRDLARRVGATRGEFRAYAVPATVNGAPALCTYHVRSRGDRIIGGGGCGVLGVSPIGFDPATAMSKPPWSKTFIDPGAAYFLLLPDGVDEVQIRLKDRTRTLRVIDNAVLFRARGLREITWRDATGATHRTRAAA